MSGRRSCWGWWRKAVAEKGAKRTLRVIGCVLAWLGAAVFAYLETAAFLWFLELLPDVIQYGYDEAAGYNLYLAEDFWQARVLLALFGVPLIATLALAVRSTIKLRRQGKKHEHPISDQR